LKIIALHTKEKKLLKEAKRNNRDAQQKLFDLYAPKMLGVCRLYVKDLHHAEDLMLTGFLKVFTKIKEYKNEGSFEGWIHRIMVNTCISYLRKKNTIEYIEEDFLFQELAIFNLENTGEKELQNLIDKLPDGYKIVFNLYAIEGFKHSEIASQLKISEGTSKSQLFKARKWLQTNYELMNQSANGDK